MLNPVLAREACEVFLIGAGGNGAQMLSVLARLHIALQELGRESGIGHVTVMDDDVVTEANIGRQVWSPSDIGRHKALVAVNRINHFYGLKWEGRPERFMASESQLGPGAWPRIVIGCVDSRRARREIDMAVRRCRHVAYYLDLGNEEHTGQVILGEPPGSRAYSQDMPRLPMVTELFPELMDKTKPETVTHSCSLRISLQNQGLFVNDMATRCAAQLLYMLFTKASMTVHGALFNIDAMRVLPLEIRRATWQRFGFETEAARPEKGAAAALKAA